MITLLIILLVLMLIARVAIQSRVGLLSERRAGPHPSGIDHSRPRRPAVARLRRVVRAESLAEPDGERFDIELALRGTERDAFQFLVGGQKMIAVHIAE